MEPGKRKKQKLNSYDDLFPENTAHGNASEVLIQKLHDFRNHPFSVKDDEDMEDLVQSIRDKGILVPLTVRPLGDEEYEIISGHRRKHAAERAGLFKVPVFIKNLSDPDAVDVMIYSNVQRANILPSEKATAYRMQMEMIRHPGRKGSSASGLGNKYGDNVRKVQRYIRLTFLLRDLLDMVDNKQLTLQAGYWLSFLGEKEQRWVLKVFHDYSKLPSSRTAQQLKNESEDHVLTLDSTEDLILGNGFRRKVTLKSKRIDQFFPPEYDSEQIEEIVYALLEQWKKETD